MPIDNTTAEEIRAYADLPYNSHKAILAWAFKNVYGAMAQFTEAESLLLFDLAAKLVSQGYLRGDITEQWLSMGFSPDRFVDLYR